MFRIVYFSGTEANENAEPLRRSLVDADDKAIASLPAPTVRTPAAPDIDGDDEAIGSVPIPAKLPPAPRTITDGKVVLPIPTPPLNTDVNDKVTDSVTTPPARYTAGMSTYVDDKVIDFAPTLPARNVYTGDQVTGSVPTSTTLRFTVAAVELPIDVSALYAHRPNDDL